MSKVRQLFSATPQDNRGAQSLHQLSEEMERYAKDRHRMLVGFPTFERMTHLSNGQYVLLGGRPGAYKTSLSLVWAYNLALSGKQVCWVDLDKQHWRLMNALLSRATGIPKNRITDHHSGARPLSLDEFSRAKAAAERIAATPFSYLPCGRDIDEFFEDVCTVPYDAIFVDYLQLLQVTGTRTPWEGIEIISKALSWISKLPHKPLVVGISQLTRGAEQRDTGPLLSDFSGSNRLEYDADVIASLVRVKSDDPLQQGVVELHLLKNRDGPLGTIPLQAFGDRGEVIETIADPLADPTPQTGTYIEPREPGEDDT